MAGVDPCARRSVSSLHCPVGSVSCRSADGGVSSCNATTGGGARRARIDALRITAPLALSAATTRVESQHPAANAITDSGGTSANMKLACQLIAPKLEVSRTTGLPSGAWPVNTATGGRCASILARYRCDAEPPAALKEVGRVCLATTGGKGAVNSGELGRRLRARHQLDEIRLKKCIYLSQSRDCAL